MCPDIDGLRAHVAALLSRFVGCPKAFLPTPAKRGLQGTGTFRSDRRPAPRGRVVLLAKSTSLATGELAAAFMLARVCAGGGVAAYVG